MRSTLPVLLLLLAAATAQAGSLPGFGSPLEGVSAVEILIEGLGPHAKQGGLDADDLRRDVELKLRLAKIKIEEDGHAKLYLNVSAFERNGEFIFQVDVRLLQDVIVYNWENPENQGVFTTAATWSAPDAIGVVPAQDFVEMVRSTVKDQIDRFLNAYLKANQ